MPTSTAENIIPGRGVSGRINFGLEFLNMLWVFQELGQSLCGLFLILIQGSGYGVNPPKNEIEQE